MKFVVFDRNTNFDRFRTRLTNYEYSSSQVSTEYIDPDQRPVQAKEYEIQQYGTVVVEYMGRRERVTTDAEQDITNALIKVLNPAKKKVYFLGGHGEKDTAVSERTGYSGIADALKRDNYEFDKLVLAQTNEIPADATVLVARRPAHRSAGAGSAAAAGLPEQVRQAAGAAGPAGGPEGSFRRCRVWKRCWPSGA